MSHPEKCPDCGKEVVEEDGYTYCKGCARLFFMEGDPDSCPHCKVAYHHEQGLLVCPECGMSGNGDPITGTCPYCKEEGWLEQRTKAWISCLKCGITFPASKLETVDPEEWVATCPHCQKSGTFKSTAGGFLECDQCDQYFTPEESKAAEEEKESDRIIPITRAQKPTFGVCPHCDTLGLFTEDGVGTAKARCDVCDRIFQFKELGAIKTPLIHWKGGFTGCYRCGTPYSEVAGRSNSWAVCSKCDSTYFPALNNPIACSCTLGTNKDHKDFVIPLGFTEKGQRWFCTLCHNLIFRPFSTCTKCSHKRGVVSPMSTLGYQYWCPKCHHDWVEGSSSRDDDDQDGRYFRRILYSGKGSGSPLLQKSIRRRYVLVDEL